MATRVPLVIDASLLHLRELPATDNLNLSSSAINSVGDINSSGVITATKFVGDGSLLTGVASTERIITGTAATFNSLVDINGDLDVDGKTDLDDLSVAGVSTFAAAVDINNNVDVLGFIDVDGQATLDDLNVAGVSTLGGAVDINNNVDISGFIDVDGQATLDDLNVAGVSTLGGAVDINNNVDVSGFIDVDGQATLDDLNVAGVSTLGGAVDINNNVDVSGFIDVDGQATLDDLNVSGISTLAQLKMGSVTATSILDEDNMASNSATALATQQSIKAYVDTQVTAQDLDFQADSGGALSIDLDSETLTIAGTSNEIETAGSGNQVTVGLPNNVTVSGNLTVGGVLQYEDVVNIDSVGIVTAREGVFIPDTKKLEIGNAAGSGDLKLHHTSGNSFIENGTGTLKLRGATIELSNPSAAQMLLANSTSSVNLYHNGNKKFETTASGTLVTGNIAATGEIKALTLFESTSGNDLRLNAGSANRDIFLQVNDTTLATVQGSTGNLGINQTSPNARIEITDTSTAQIRLGYNQSKYVRIGRNSSGHYEFFSQENGAPLVFGTAASADGGGAEKMRIDRHGNVNIGGEYAQTDAKVWIQDSSRPIQEATLNLASSATSGAVDTGAVLRFYGHDGSSARYHSSIKGAKENGTSGNHAGYLAFNTRPNGGAMVERARIDSGGRLLVGHTASQNVYATCAVQVQGTSVTDTCLSLLRHGGSPYLALGATGGSSLGSVTALSSGDRIGQLTFAGADGTDVNTHAASIGAYVDGSVSSNTVPGRIVFSTSTGAGEPERMRLDSSGRLLIGRTATHASSAEKLSVNGMTSIQLSSTSTSPLYVFNEDTTSGSIQPFFFMHDGGGIRGGHGIERDTGKYVINGQHGLSFRVNNSGTAGTERLFIDTSGRHCINTTSANSQVNINGGSSSNVVTIRNTTLGNGNVGILFSTQDHSGGREKAAIYHQETHGQAHYGGDFIFCLANSTGGASQVAPSDERMRITRGGEFSLSGDTDTNLSRTGTNEWTVKTNGNVCTKFRANQRVHMPTVWSTNGSSGRDVEIESDGNLFAGNTSLRAAKKNIVSQTDVSWLYDLNPVTFNYRKHTVDDVTGVNTYLEEIEEHTSYGLIAEEVEAVKKDFCFYNKDEDGNDKLEGVSYKHLITPLLKALQDQKKEIDDLKTKVAALESS